MIVTPMGRYLLVCINGCTPSGQTKGVRDMVQNERYDTMSNLITKDPRFNPQLEPAPRMVTSAGSPVVHNPEESTMRATPGWNALMFAEPGALIPVPTEMADAVAKAGLPPPRGDPHFSTTKAAPVRMFICEVCGYVELYAGIIADKKVWG